MTTGHENWLEQSEIYSLGALDGQELRDFEAHLEAGCAICDAYRRETSETLNLLHRSLRPAHPPPAVKTRLMNQIGGERMTPIPNPRAQRPRRWQAITGVIAAGIIGAVASGAFYHQRYEPRHSVYSQVIDLLRDPATRDYPLYGAGPAPSALGRFLWNPSGEGHIFVSNLPPPSPDKMYAVWTIPQGASPRYAGRITTDAAGRGGLHIKSTGEGQPIATFAVSLEPLGAIDAPSGPIVLASKSS